MIEYDAEMPTTQTLTIKLRLRDKHAASLNKQARAVNFVWNYCNEMSRKAWGRDHRWLSAYNLQKLTAGSSKLLGLHSHTIKQVCAQFERSRNMAKRSSLRWRGQKSLGWVPFGTGHVTFDGRTLQFNGVKYEAMHINPRVRPGLKFGAASFNADREGRWYVNLVFAVECADVPARNMVGVDLGLKALATLSDGVGIELPRFYRDSETALATAQRARKTSRARAIHAKIANRRKDFLHKASNALAKEYGLIVVGDVSPSKLAQTKMAKSVLNAGWAGFKDMISYKARMHGGRMIEVSERMTTQVCSECGSLPASRPKGIAHLGIREWTCSDCGAAHDRDHNAAKNILRVGMDTLVEGAALSGASKGLSALNALLAQRSNQP